MMDKIKLVLISLAFLFSPLTFADQFQTVTSNDVNEELLKKLSDVLPGEKIDYHSGEVLHYLETVSIEGNGLPIKLGHSYRHYTYTNDDDLSLVQLEIPHINFKHSGQANYLRLRNGGESNDYWEKITDYKTNINCANLKLPSEAPFTYYDNTIGIKNPNAFLLSGIKIKLGFDAIDFYPNDLQSSSRFPSNAIYISPSNWYIICVSSPNVTGSNAFKAVSPNGLEYFFDIYQEDTHIDGVGRTTDTKIYVSKIIDKHGNELIYDYYHDDLPCPGGFHRCWFSPSGMYYRSRIKSISSSDGRALDIVYGNKSITVTSNSTSHPIKLVYQETSKTQLKITRQDKKYWLYNFSKQSYQLGSNLRVVSVFNYINNITYPNALNVEYIQEPRPISEYRLDTLTARNLAVIDQPKRMALKERRVSGPGMQTWVDKYTYSNNYSAGENTTIVESPHRTVVYKYKEINYAGNMSKIHLNTGKLLQKKIYSPDTTATNYSSKTPLKQVDYSYSRQANVIPPNYIRDHYYIWQGISLSSYPTVVTHLHGSYKTVASSITTQMNGHSFSQVKSDYDEWGHPQTITETSTSTPDANRVITRTYYNDKPSWIIGQLATESINGESARSVINYDPTTGSVTDKTINGIKESYTYHTDGNLKEVKDADGVVFKTYSDYYRGIPRNEYDGENNLKRTEVYDYGKIKSETDFNGNPATTYEYDAVHRLSKITPPKGAVTTIEWPDEVTKVTTRAGYKQTINYNALMEPLTVKEEDTSRLETKYTKADYDAVGRVIHEYIPSYDSAETAKKIFEYDALNRITSITEPGDASSTTICYGTACNATRSGKSSVQHGEVVTDTLGYETIRNYRSYSDPNDKDLIEIQQQKDSTAYIETRMTRGKHGQIKTIKQNNITRSFTYKYDTKYQEGTLLVETKTEPETGKTTYGYDVRGNLSSKQVGASGITYYHYWNNNLIEHIDYPGSTLDVTYTYQGHNLDHLITGANTTDWDYDFDAVNQIEKETLSIDGLNFTTEYVYDSLGNLDRLRLPNIEQPNGRYIEYTKDALSRTRAIYDSNSDYVTDINYYANDVVKEMTYANGYFYTATLNNKFVPENIHTTDNILNLVDLTYTYDDEENVTGITDAALSNNNRSMGYDGLGRLTSANGRWGNGVISYDDDHDISSMTLGSKSLSYHYNSSNRLDSVTGGVSKTFSYDNYGNVKGNGSDSFSYDDASQLLSVTNQGINYSYDGNKKRVKVKAPDKTIYYIYNLAGELLYRYDQTNKKDIEYVNLNGKLVAKLEHGPSVVSTIVPDSDKDGLNDRDEILWGTKPNNPDSDGDGIKDGDEIAFWGTSPTKWDTDGDGLNDHFEIQYGLSATNPDTDGDSISDANEDTDSDGLNNLAEQTRGTNPTKADTDGDLINDGTEVAQGRNPLMYDKPPVPGGLTTPVSDTDGAYSISWSSALTATSYQLQEKKDSGAWATIYNGSARSKAVSGHASGNWYYRVQGCNHMGCSALSTQKSTLVLLPPATPTLSTPTSDIDGAYTVSWNAVTGSTRYQLEEKLNSGAWTVIQNTSATSIARSGKGSGTYYYQVKACNSSGCSAFSTRKSTLVLLPPATPTLSAPASDIDGVYTVSWTSVKGSARYQVEEKVNSGAWTVIQNTSATSIARSGKGSGTYSYQAKACNTSGCSAFSAQKVTAVALPPTTPGGLSSPANDIDGTYTVSWSAVTAANLYELQEQKNNGAWVMVHSGTTTSKVLTGRGNGTYRYRVRASNGSGASAFSVTKTTVVLFRPVVPGGLTIPASNTDGTYSVSWNAVSTATSYELVEKKNNSSWVTVHSSNIRSKLLTGRGSATYYYRVRACNISGCGAYSVTKTITVLLPPDKPNLIAPSRIIEGGRIILTWGSGGTGATYQLQRASQIGSSYRSPWVTVYEGGLLSYTTASITNPFGYHVFRVRACNSSGCSNYSDETFTSVTKVN